MKKRLVLLMALSLTFAFPAAVMAEDTTAAEETADDTEAADSTAEDADVKSEGVMTHDEYLAAAVDDEVTIETYVQAKQSWWEDKATFYTQDKDGAYFIYNMPCSEEDYEKLVPGTKIKVTGYKAEWSGEIEVADVSSFEIEDGQTEFPDRLFAETSACKIIVGIFSTFTAQLVIKILSRFLIDFKQGCALLCFCPCLLGIFDLGKFHTGTLCQMGKCFSK